MLWYIMVVCCSITVCVFIFEINVYDIFGAHNCIISRDNYVVGDKVTA